MSVMQNILRVNNVRGVVTSVIDRGADAQLINQDSEGVTDKSLFDNSLNEALQARGEQPITVIPLDVAIRYTPEMSSVFTQNPVQIGVNVNDHTYNNPDTLTVYFGTSDVKGTLARMKGLISTVQNGFDNIKNNKTPSRILLDLLYRAKEERTRFQVDDGLRTYTDMIIQSITYDKDASNYRALVATIVLQQFIFVKVETGSPSGLRRAPVQPLNKSTFAKSQQYIDSLKLF